MVDRRRMVLLAVLLIFFVFTLTGAKPTSSSNEPCKPDKLTVYKVVFTTHWTTDKFPKQYPEFRPHAQWSKLVGRSHDSSYILWRLGTDASDGLKIFSETGKSDVLDAQSQGEGGIYDEFSAPAINTGAGKTEAEFFVDGNHSRVSLVTRIIPSPDWFVGIDGLDLCVQGTWIDSVTVEADPIDAGTDNGFTFTAPNWATLPQENIYRITSTYPDHPANSFYYPHLKRLPPLATFRFLKVKEYELSQVFYHAEADEDVNAHVYDDVSNAVHVLHHNDQPATTPSTTSTTTSTTTTTAATTTTAELPPTTTPTTTSMSFTPRRHHHHVHGTLLRPQIAIGKPKLDAPSATDIINNIVQSYDSSRKIRKNKKGTKQARAPRHCHVSEWSEWSPCSKTCGIGEMKRTRTVTKHARRGGKPCPALHENKWCGSARACKDNIDHYFNW